MNYVAQFTGVSQSRKSNAYTKQADQDKDLENSKDSFKDLMNETQNPAEGKDAVTDKEAPKPDRPAAEKPKEAEGRIFTDISQILVSQMLIVPDTQQPVLKTVQPETLPWTEVQTVQVEAENSINQPDQPQRIQPEVLAGFDNSQRAEQIPQQMQKMIQEMPTAQADLPQKAAPEQNTPEIQVQSADSSKTEAKTANSPAQTSQMQTEQKESGKTETPTPILEQSQVMKPEQSEAMVTVKVGDSTPLDGKQVEKGLGDTIMVKLADNQKEFDVQLEPLNLGKIHIKLEILEAGIKVLITCENPKTMGLLSEHSNGISNMIQQNLNQQQQVTVQVKEDAAYWNQEQQKDQSGQQEQQQKKQDEKESEDFVQQLRLGLLL